MTELAAAGRLRQATMMIDDAAPPLEPPALAVVREVLGAYPKMAAARCTPVAGGLINQTYAVQAARGQFILQRLNPMFDAHIHYNIEAVTRRLSQRGVTTPRLLPTRDGQLWIRATDGAAWRLMTRVEGTSYHTLSSPAQAHSAGRLVGRFHAALEGLTHAFVGLRRGVHDTVAHRRRLQQALQQHQQHPLYPRVAPLAQQILGSMEQLETLPAVPLCIGHGDLKISNLLFRPIDPCAVRAPATAAEQAHCLIDLDTLAPMPLAHELGDAWRSWCNRATEDAAAVFDMALFETSLAGYRAGNPGEWSLQQRRALLLGPELISVALAARFAADALFEDYFGWDKRRYARAGQHNLARAKGQYSLFHAIVDTRRARERLLAEA